MLTIGALARLAGITPRAVRHYHAVGVLPEPTRRANGYREYDLRDAVRLVRVRRLVELGLSLPEVADTLKGDDAREHGLREILGELDRDLAHQEQAIRARRHRLAQLLEREENLLVSDDLSELLGEIGSVAWDASADALQRERELLEMIEATEGAERFRDVVGQYRALLADSDTVARMTALAARFEALAAVAPTDPEVEAVARELAASGVEQFPGQEQKEPDESWAPTWSAFLATLPPAQRRCLELARRHRCRPQSQIRRRRPRHGCGGDPCPVPARGVKGIRTRRTYGDRPARRKCVKVDLWLVLCASRGSVTRPWSSISEPSG